MRSSGSKSISTTLLPTEDAFLPIVEGTPFGVICVIQTEDGRYLGSELGLAASSKQTQSKQQKIFSGDYGPHALWRLKPAHDTREWSGMQWRPSPEKKTLVRFEHIVTTRNLHSHQNFALGNYGHEVTGYGNFGRGDENDNWEIALLNDIFTVTHTLYKGILCAKSSPDSEKSRQEDVYAVGVEQFTADPSLWAGAWRLKFLPTSGHWGRGPGDEKAMTFCVLTNGDGTFVKKEDVPEIQRDFDTLPEVHKFFEDEQAKWTFIDYTSVNNQRDAVFGNLIGSLGQMLSTWANSTSKQVRDLALNCLRENATRQKWLWSWQTPGKEIVALASSNSMTATWATAISMKIPSVLSDAAQTGEDVYYFEARMFLEAISKRNDAEYENEKEAFIIKSSQEYQNEITSLKEFISNSRATIHQQLSEVESKSIQVVGAYDQLLVQGTADLGGLTERYQEAIKNSQIQKDLDSKSKGHRNWFYGFSFAAVLTGYLSFRWILHTVLPQTVKALDFLEREKLDAMASAKTPEAAKAIAETIAHPTWFAYLKLALLITLALYVTRLLVRLAMSQFHQWQDASERLVLLRTYFTILDIIEKKGDKFTDAERAIVIGSIYRPGTVGVVKDEHGASLSITETISKLLESKG